jgi:hypothetical protein
VPNAVLKRPSEIPAFRKLLEDIREKLGMMRRELSLEPDCTPEQAAIWYEEYEDYGRRPFRGGKEKAPKDGD